MSRLLCPIIATCEKTEIKLAGSLSLESVNGGFVQIPEPSAHTGPRPIALRVLSFQQRFGLVLIFYNNFNCYFCRILLVLLAIEI